MKDSSSQMWFYTNSENQPTGPVTFDELQQLAASGEISLETFVTREGDSEWITLQIASLPSVPNPAPISQPPPLPYLSVEKMWWYVDKTKQQVGPITLDELVGLRKSGMISDQTLVFKKGRDEWEIFTVAVAFEEGIPTLPEPFQSLLPSREVKDFGAAEIVEAKGLGVVTIIGSILAILLGIALCFTLIGALIGVPMIIGAFRALGTTKKNWGTPLVEIESKKERERRERLGILDGHMQYKVVGPYLYPEKLADEVAKLITQGWEPNGGIEGSGFINKRYTQAMIKKPTQSPNE